MSKGVIDRTLNEDTIPNTNSIKYDFIKEHQIKEIAQRQGISDKYLEQIITMLSRAGYVKSVRGASGSHILFITLFFYQVVSPSNLLKSYYLLQIQ